MFGIILTAIGTLFEEVSSSFGKWEINHHRENMYTFGFLNVFWAFWIFVGIVLWKGTFDFDPASIPLLSLLIVLEMVQIYVSLHAITLADRSTLGFLMVGTVPLLLLVDLILGYSINISSMIGVILIVFSILILFLNHGIGKQGLRYVIFAATNAVATISLYKYLITHYNAVEAQQIVTYTFIMIFLYFMSVKKYGDHPVKYIFSKEFLIHPISRGVGSVLVSLAYMYAPASVITSGKRSFSLLWSITSGNKYFHEKHLVVKFISFLLVLSGLILLVI